MKRTAVIRHEACDAGFCTRLHACDAVAVAKGQVARVACQSLISKVTTCWQDVPAAPRGARCRKQCSGQRRLAARPQQRRDHASRSRAPAVKGPTDWVMMLMPCTRQHSSARGGRHRLELDAGARNARRLLSHRARAARAAGAHLERSRSRPSAWTHAQAPGLVGGHIGPINSERPP